MEKFDASWMEESCRKFCSFYGALSRDAEEAGKQAWVAKPKMHLMQELAEYQSHELGKPAQLIELFWVALIY